MKVRTVWCQRPQIGARTVRVLCSGVEVTNFHYRRHRYRYHQYCNRSIMTTTIINLINTSVPQSHHHNHKPHLLRALWRHQHRRSHDHHLLPRHRRRCGGVGPLPGRHLLQHLLEQPRGDAGGEGEHRGGVDLVQGQRWTGSGSDGDLVVVVRCCVVRCAVCCACVGL